MSDISITAIETKQAPDVNQFCDTGQNIPGLWHCSKTTKSVTLLKKYQICDTAQNYLVCDTA